MAHALYHARSSARRFGGVAGDYMDLHRWMDHTKSHLADARHRLVLHNSWGISLAEQIFGVSITRASDGKEVPTRTVLERHVLEDLGRIPTLEQCLAQVQLEPWMYRNAEPLSQETEENNAATKLRAMDSQEDEGNHASIEQTTSPRPGTGSEGTR